MHVSEIEGDGAGYDIKSYTPDGKVRYIEVKTTRGAIRTPFLCRSMNFVNHIRNTTICIACLIFKWKREVERCFKSEVISKIQNYALNRSIFGSRVDPVSEKRLAGSWLSRHKSSPLCPRPCLSFDRLGTKFFAKFTIPPVYSFPSFYTNERARRYSISDAWLRPFVVLNTRPANGLPRRHRLGVRG